MTPSQRIILNTLATYGRSLLGIAVGLFSARWVLQALGQTDFGLYGVVGAIVIFITFLNGVMSGSVARFYAYAIGSQSQDGPKKLYGTVRQWFNTALSIHLFLPVILIAIGYPIGEYAIRHWLTIPPDRVLACVWVLRISLVTAMVNVASVPFTAMYVAHQYITELVIFGMLGLIATFVGAYFLLSAPGDRLLIYSLYMMAVNAGIPILQVIRARLMFPACRFDRHDFLNRDRRRRLTRFAGWQLFGGAGALLRGPGTAVLINLFFGPRINASFSIANQLSAQTATLSSSLTNALQPALTTLEGSGNRSRVNEFAIRASKFATLLVLLFAVPLALEMETVLRFWLKNPPQYTGALCIFMLVTLLLDKVTIGHSIAIAAQGDIAAYQTVLGSCLLASLPLTWLFFRQGMGPLSLGISFFLTVGACSLGRLYFGSKQLNIPLAVWLTRVLLPLGAAALAALGAGLLVRHLLPPTFARLCLTTAMTLTVAATVGWCHVFDKDERRFILRQLGKGWDRIKPSIHAA